MDGILPLIFSGIIPSNPPAYAGGVRQTRNHGRIVPNHSAFRKRNHRTRPAIKNDFTANVGRERCHVSRPATKRTFCRSSGNGVATKAACFENFFGYHIRFEASDVGCWLSRHSEGDSNVTNGAAVDDAAEEKSTAIVKVARINRDRSYHFVLRKTKPRHKLAAQ